MHPAVRRLCLVLGAALLAITGCSSWQKSYVMQRLDEEGVFDVQAARAAFCANGGHGSPARDTPIVCVDKDPYTADPVPRPDPVKAWRKHNGKPVKIRWLAVSPSWSLDVKWPVAGCVQPSTKHRYGGDVVEVSTDDTMTDHMECKYEIELDGKVLDPTVIVDQCCM